MSWWLEGSVLEQPVPGWNRFLGRFAVRLVPLAAIIVLGLAAPSRLSSPWMPPWVLATLIVGLALRFQLELLARAGLAEAADERLTAIVGRAAGRVGIDRPAVYVIAHHQPNAFIAESPSSSAFRQVMHFVWIPVVAIKPILGSWGSAGLVVFLGIFTLVLLVLRGYAATLETRSDTYAIGNSEEARVFGHALGKIYRVGLIPAVLRRATHGQLSERMEAAGLTTDFDPPTPPPMGAVLVPTGMAILVGLVVFLAPYLATAGADLSSPTAAQVALSLGSYGSWPLERLGQLADVEGDYAAAEVFYAAAAEASDDPGPLVDLVYVRSVLGRCQEAETALISLTDRNGRQDDVLLATEWVEWCRER
jgi:Zn-dependent protease with chaperone function